MSSADTEIKQINLSSYKCLGETGPEAEQQHRLYDTWLVGQGDFLEGQVKYLEQQIQKQKRTKKAINARNRQVYITVSFYLRYSMHK